MVPPVSTRRWLTPAGNQLIEGDHSTVHFHGLAIPELEAAFTYYELDPGGEMLHVLSPERQRSTPYGDHYTLIRYQVQDTQLIRFESHCYEESTYDAPFTGQPRRIVVLSGLTPDFPSRS